MININFQCLGDTDKPAVILLHGLLGSSNNLRSLAKSLQHNYCCYLLDLPNHGKSDHSTDISFNYLSSCIYDWMLQYNIAKPHIIGHSLGGKVAMRFAMDYSSKIKSVLVLDIAPKAYKNTGTFDNILTAILAIDTASLKSRQQADDLLAKYIDPVSTRRFLLLSLEKQEQGYKWLFNAKLLYKNSHQWLASPVDANETSDIPVVFMRGSKSNYIADSDKPLINKHFSQATIIDIANAGHWLHADAEQQVLSATTNWLENNP